MLKIFLALAVLLFADQVAAQVGCPYPFTNSFNGYNFNNCYYYVGGNSNFALANQKCLTTVFNGIISPKNQGGLDDLYKLYKAYPHFYFWVGAIATPANPKVFKWQDGSLVPSTSWCSGHPQGGDNLCAFYTTPAIFGRDKCILSGACTNNIFDFGVYCQYGVTNSTQP